MPAKVRFQDVLLSRTSAGVALSLLVVVFVGCMSIGLGGASVENLTPDTSDKMGVIQESSGLVKQEGQVTLQGGTVQKVFYPLPFASPPNLELTPPEGIRPEFSVIKQERDHFVVENTDRFFSRTFRWCARGLKQGPAPPPSAEVELPARPVPITK